ncbi:unnamed protein product, partial [Mesorhabditis spiculigera]
MRDISQAQRYFWAISRRAIFDFTTGDSDGTAPCLNAACHLMQGPTNGAPAVPTPAPIHTDNPKYGAFMDVVKLLKPLMNTTIDPCDDFYAFTCGSMDASMEMSFDVSDNDNALKMARQFRKQYYLDISPLPVKQVAWYFQACRAANLNPDSFQNGAPLVQALANLQANVPGVPFPALNQTVTNVQALSPAQLGGLVGYLAGSEGIPTLLTPFADTNWRDPHGPQPYSLFIDQPSTIYGYTYHTKAYDLFHDTFVNTIKANLRALAKVMNMPALNENKLDSDAKAMVDFEHQLILAYSTDDTTRRQYKRSYNPVTRNNVTAMFPFIDWRTFLAHTIAPAGADVYYKVVHDENYPFLLVEPGKLMQLQADFPSFDQRVVANYLYYRLVDTYAGYLPAPSGDVVRGTEGEDWEKPTLYKPTLGRPRHISPDQKRFTKTDGYTDDQVLDINCAGETTFMLPYANARAFVDNIYPTQADRDAIRYNVRQLAESILIGFRGMIDQLSWMSRSTKQGAFAKIENLVKNIAFPDWITDDKQLADYHLTLDIKQNDDYVTMAQKANAFNLQMGWLYLLRSSGSDRVDFNGPPGTTNAWYQPELNSITFPAAILRQPFYDPNWPAAMNFGSMGVIAGHELTHGFDDEGVQWDGTGGLNGWMDQMSSYYFSEMADCVVQEYSGFCPLPANYSTAACIDGAQTQGENIADNGGIHSAFRAYKAYVNLHGPDPLLPDDDLSQLTADQLFFIAFAQPWCQLPPTAQREMRQLLVDVHSPSLYRVFGTIQNFPAFKTAYNCPYNTKYAPEKHCNVWVSDVKQSTGIPAIGNDLNIPTAAPIAPRNLSVYAAYQQATDFFAASVDLTADPCNDFYKYSCGNYKGVVSFHLADEKNKAQMATKLMDPAYDPIIQSSAALKKTKQFFQACQKAAPNMANDLKTLDLVKPKVDALKAKLGADFTAVFSQINPVTVAPTPTQLADALAYLSFTLGVDTLISPMVDTNWKNPETGYYLHVDQNTAYYSKSYYQPGAFQIIQPTYLANARTLLTNFATSQNLSLDPNALTKVLTDVINFEQLLATTYSTDDTTRRQYARSWNPNAISDLNNNYPFLDWTTYFKNVPAIGALAADKMVNIIEPDQFKNLSSTLANIASPDVLVNYLYVRMVLAYQDLVPSYGQGRIVEPKEWRGLGRSRRSTQGQKNVIPLMSDVSDVDVGCAGATLDLMQFSNGRVFVDVLYPDQAAKDVIRKTAGGLISNVLNAFHGMLDALDWMDDDSKKGAYDKVLNIAKNVAFPDWITNNDQLDAYYQQLNLAADDSYYTILDKLTAFNLWAQYNQLTFTKTDRHDFLGQPGIVNAWYQPELNSITFPAGILRPPYFHPEWPASLNYGGMGLVAGHELTHGFDDEGVQWDGTGVLNGWMSTNSTIGFTTMAQCIIDEYRSFCPLKGTTYQPQCLNGQNTQGENIADNGGIHSAYRAFKTHQNLNGPDPLLNDRIFGQFNHDQLFFLNFGQVWCQEQESPAAYFRQILVDPHSPANYRVFGTIQNFPAFRSAFNCPANSAYAPADHCQVWVPTSTP